MSSANIKKIGIITSGGDCGGLNAVIKGAAQMAFDKGIDVNNYKNIAPSEDIKDYIFEHNLGFAQNIETGEIFEGCLKELSRKLGFCSSNIITRGKSKNFILLKGEQDVF